MWMPGERWRYCLVNSLQCQIMRRWMDMRPSVEWLYSLFRMHETCCTGMYNIVISIQDISIMWWMCEAYAKHVGNWTQHLLKEDGCYDRYATKNRMYRTLWSHKICTGFSRSVRYSVYPVNHTLKMTRGPIITTRQKIMAPAASYLVPSILILTFSVSHMNGTLTILGSSNVCVHKSETIARIGANHSYPIFHLLNFHGSS